MEKFIAIALLVILFGCELIVDIDVPQTDPALTLNSFFSPDSVWKAKVSKNRYILDQNPFLPVNHATLVIYRDNNPIDTLVNLGNGIYQASSEKPIVGEVYEIRASAPGFEPVTAKSQIPSPISISHAEITFPEPTSNINEDPPPVSITIKFQDIQGQRNFYQVIMYTEYEYTDAITGETSVDINPIDIDSNNPAIDNEDYSSYSGAYFKDVLFDGQEVSLHFNASNWSVSRFNKVIICLRTVSEDFFNYKTTFLLQERTSGDPFAQPVNVFNNIENGYGIFAGYSSSKYIYEPPGYNIKPIINKFTPAQGKTGDQVKIFGENFSTILYNNYVMFNGRLATVLKATDKELIVSVPTDATTGKIAVRVYPSGKVGFSDSNFVVIK